MEDIAVSAVLRPLDVKDVLDALDVHGKTLQAIGDLCRNRLDVHAANLLEVGELRDLHAVEPNFPAKPPGAQGRRLPVVLDEADVVLLGIDAETFETFQIKLLDVVGRRLQDDLELMVLVKTIRVVAVSSVRRTTRRLDVGDIPRLGAQNAQEGRRVHRTRSLLHIIRLRQDAALLAPELLQSEDDLLKLQVKQLLISRNRQKKSRPATKCRRDETYPAVPP